MAKSKKKTSGLLEFVSPLVKRLSEELTISDLESHDVEAIKEVEASNGTKVIVNSCWNGTRKPWSLSVMDDTDKAYEGAVKDMLGAHEDDAYWIQIYKIDGTCFSLTGEAVKVTYVLDEI
jgi:hypothetical protein